MLRSLFSAISGLQAHQTMMDVVGNNIANVNTVGYKSSSTDFEDTLSQMLRNGSAPTADSAGTNPAQVGLGVKVGAISTNFTQGSTESTGRDTDFMISGDGFFVTKQGNQQLYTRAGSLDFDGSNRLVTPDGGVLQGWMATNGTVNTNGPIGALSIPYGQTIPPVATSTGIVTGNLDSSATPTSAAAQTQATMYDSLGHAHEISYNFTNTGTNTWAMSVLDENGNSMLGGTKAAPTTMAISFDSSGKINLPAPAVAGKFQFTPDPTTYPSWAGPVTVDLTGVNQFGSASSLAVGTPTTGAGSEMGTLNSFSLGDDGTITGVYSNGLRQPIGQLALATFVNPGGLSKAGNSSYEAGDNSGAPQIGVAGTGGRGTLSSGALEMSNVDLAQQFTNLIIAQRGFQANSKVITTSDQILQSLVDMKQ
jgi:flagellar hook protein FlgE